MNKGGIYVRRYMREVIEDHRDPLTGEVSLSTLAEDACQHVDGYENDDIPERYFELAFEVDESDRRQRSGQIGSALGHLMLGPDDCLRG